MELTKDSQVYIPTTQKNQLKVDHSKNSKMMLMETLFVLYGQDAFKSLPIAVRGNKPGSYAIEPHIVTAVLGKGNFHLA